MSALKIIVTVIYCIVAIAFTASVLMQEGKSAGLGAIGGMAESYWGKNKGRSMEGKLERFTLIGAIIFFVGAILLSQIAAAVLCLFIRSAPLTRLKH